MLDAYKRLHDSKKRGQRSLAEVPMEHLAKVHQRRQLALKDRFCALVQVWTTKHMDRSDHQGLEHRSASSPDCQEDSCLSLKSGWAPLCRSHHSTRGEARPEAKASALRHSTRLRCEVLTHLPQKPHKYSKVYFKWAQLVRLLNLRKKTDLVLAGHCARLRLELL